MNEWMQLVTERKGNNEYKRKIFINSLFRNNLHLLDLETWTLFTRHMQHGDCLLQRCFLGTTAPLKTAGWMNIGEKNPCHCLWVLSGGAHHSKVSGWCYLSPSPSPPLRGRGGVFATSIFCCHISNIHLFFFLLCQQGLSYIPGFINFTNVDCISSLIAIENDK